VKNALPSILLLTTAVFLTGLAENIFIGILPEVAYAPFAALVAFHLDIKFTLIVSLIVFAISNIAIVIDYAGLGAISTARILTAMASAQIAVCAVICAVSLVDEEFKARAIGTIYLGISGSLFLGVPVGVWLTHVAGWRSTGVAMVALGLVTAALVWFKLPIIKSPKQEGSFGALFFSHLKDYKQVLGQAVSILFIAGHFVLFTFLTSYAANKGFAGPDNYLYHCHSPIGDFRK